MKLPRSATLRHVAAASFLVSSGAVHAADITQTAAAGATNDWNATAIWGGSAPTSGNNYFSASGQIALSNDRLNYDLATGRVRSLAANTFAGDTLTISAATELLMKQQGTETATANLVLAGGLVRYSPNAGAFAFSPTLAGTLTISADSYIGIEHTATSTLTIASTLFGDNTLHVRAGSTAPTKTIVFSGDISAFTGTISLGGGETAATLRFDQGYTNTSLAFVMGTGSTADLLNLNNNLTFGSFSFGVTALSPGTYSATDLNALFGTGSQFLDNGGSLTIAAVPEPSTVAMFAAVIGLAVAGFGRRRRA
jgi:hypothetical protein